MPDGVLINGKGPYRYNTSLVPDGIGHETINVDPGKATSQNKSYIILFLSFVHGPYWQPWYLYLVKCFFVSCHGELAWFLTSLLLCLTFLFGNLQAKLIVSGSTTLECLLAWIFEFRTIICFWQKQKVTTHLSRTIPAWISMLGNLSLSWLQWIKMQAAITILLQVLGLLMNQSGKESLVLLYCIIPTRKERLLVHSQTLLMIFMTHHIHSTRLCLSGLHSFCSFWKFTFFFVRLSDLLKVVECTLVCCCNLYKEKYLLTIFMSVLVACTT